VLALTFDSLFISYRPPKFNRRGPEEIVGRFIAHHDLELAYEELERGGWLKRYLKDKSESFVDAAKEHVRTHFNMG